MLEPVETPRPAAQPVNAPEFYTVAQAARMFRMSAMTLYRAIAADEFPAIRIRGRLIVPAKAVDAMVDAALADRALVDASEWVPVRNPKGA